LGKPARTLLIIFTFVVIGVALISSFGGNGGKGSLLGGNTVTLKYSEFEKDLKVKEKIRT